MRLSCAVVGAALVACSSAGTIDLEGRVCAPDEPQCLEGYVCHPERGECVCALDVGCDGASSCPQLTQTGDACPCAGAFIPCDGAADACEHGCRDCQTDGTWSECSERECSPAAPELCDGRDNDCDGLVDEAIHGCDCFRGSPGPEVCDQRDNDCNTAIDDGFECRFDSIRPCAGGSGNESCDPTTCRWSGNCFTRDGGPPAQVTLFVAEPQNARVQLSWQNPPDADLALCVVRRRVVDPPDHHLIGDLVYVAIDPTPGSAQSALDEGLTNGVRYAYAVFCRDTGALWNDTVQIGANADDAIPTAGTAENPTDLQASDGENEQSTISFTMPVSAERCRLRRNRNDNAVEYPTKYDDLDSELRFTFTSMDDLPWVDTGLENGGGYYYAAFCFNGEVWNDDVTPGDNADVGLPRDPTPDNPSDFRASDGEDSLSTLTFTMPATAECRVARRDDGIYPTAEDDGVLVGTVTAPPGLVRLVDLGLTNGAIYHYAVFCREGTTWNRERVDTANADTAGPVDIAIAYEDHVSRGTQDSDTIVSDDVTFVANRLYLAVVATRPFVPATQLSGLDFTWRLAASQCGANDETGTEIWWAFGTPAGSGQVRVSLPAPVDGGVLAVLRYRGVSSAQPVGGDFGANSGGGDCADASGSTAWTMTVPAATDSLLVGSVAILAAEHTPGSGVTERAELRVNAGSNEVATALVEAPGGGTVTLGGTLDAAKKWAVALVELLP